VKHKGTPILWNKIIGENNVKLKMQTHKLSLDEEVKNLDLNRELRWNQ
jgi:hypothetical protein